VNAIELIAALKGADEETAMELVERLQCGEIDCSVLPTGKDNAVLQAQIWAQEARTQKGIVDEIGKLVGCSNDWEMVGAVKAALSANGGEPPTWTAEDEPVAYLTWHQVRHAIDDYEDVVALSHKDDRSADGTPAFPVYTHPAPSSVAVPEQREWNQVTGRDGFKYTEGWNACREAMLTAAPSPDHSGDAGKVVPSDWEGWACHKAGKMPRLYGEKSIAEVNCDTENGERLIFLSSTPSVPENDNGFSSAYDSGYLDAMLYARVCCGRLDNPENTKDYRDCARFLDLIFKSEIDEAARLRTAGDEGEGV
jgi:hypothetical protein